MAKPENGGAWFKIDRGIKAVIQAGALYNARRHRIPSLVAYEAHWLSKESSAWKTWKTSDKLPLLVPEVSQLRRLSKSRSMLLDQSEKQMCRFVCLIVVGTLTKIFLHCGPLTICMSQINLHTPVATYVEYLQLGNCFVL
jgi:hypothetical protein